MLRLKTFQTTLVYGCLVYFIYVYGNIALPCRCFRSMVTTMVAKLDLTFRRPRAFHVCRSIQFLITFTRTECQPGLIFTKTQKCHTMRTITGTLRRAALWSSQVKLKSRDRIMRSYLRAFTLAGVAPARWDSALNFSAGVLFIRGVGITRTHHVRLPWQPTSRPFVASSAFL